MADPTPGILNAPVSKLFVGQGDLIVFDAITDYSTATLASLVNPFSLGQIVEDSSNWTGDDVSVNEIRDEQGDLITATVTAGTIAFEFDVADLSQSMMELFMQADPIDSASLASVFFGTTTPTVTAVGFGHKLPVITRPIAWLNDELNRLFLIPKAKISSNFANSDKLMRIHCSVIGESVDTSYLKTGMLFDSTAAAQYRSE